MGKIQSWIDKKIYKAYERHKRKEEIRKAYSSDVTDVYARAYKIKPRK